MPDEQKGNQTVSYRRDLFRGYYDISNLHQSGEDLKKQARDAYLSERKRQEEGEALLSSVDFDAAILVWQNQVKLEIKLPKRQNLHEEDLGLTEDEQRELHNWELQAIYDQGGALNWPGFYYPNQQIIDLIERKLKEKGLK